MKNLKFGGGGAGVIAGQKLPKLQRNLSFNIWVL